MAKSNGAALKKKSIEFKKCPTCGFATLYKDDERLGRIEELEQRMQRIKSMVCGDRRP